MHTPHPWTKNHDLDGRITTIRGGPVADGAIAPPMVCKVSKRESRTETDANADLICAAPALLNAARKAYKLIEALMPGVAHITLADYAALNETPIALANAIRAARPNDPVLPQ